MPQPFSRMTDCTGFFISSLYFYFVLRTETDGFITSDGIAFVRFDQAGIQDGDGWDWRGRQAREQHERMRAQMEELFPQVMQICQERDEEWQCPGTWPMQITRSIVDEAAEDDCGFSVEELLAQPAWLLQVVEELRERKCKIDQRRPTGLGSAGPEDEDEDEDEGLKQQQEPWCSPGEVLI
eukprot:TRINITY_DN8501_c0_g1_i1.p1 TRINITY_DN8501_c0_g1~~TRINITY_DN8501_c0_g1_i1.p1  ORF type:complete len:181 (-),score=29.16 TRINITY_DN8501_c0_g1_i1:209-751(-)